MFPGHQEVLENLEEDTHKGLGKGISWHPLARLIRPQEM